MSPRGAIWTPFSLLRNRKDWFLAAVHSGYLLLYFSPAFFSFSCFSLQKVRLYADAKRTKQDEVQRVITTGLNVMFQLGKMSPCG